MIATPNGLIFYQGPSRIDGAPIVAIATLKTDNIKTGDLVQTWILRSDIHPQTAVDLGADKSICGSCPLRGEIRPASERLKKGDQPPATPTVNRFRACYVTIYSAPTQVYRSFSEGKYPVFAPEHATLLAERSLRYGAYGDPAAVPLRSWRVLEQLATGSARPGYTHQWRRKAFQPWARKVMASTHSLADNAIAHSLGFRTFRTLAREEDIAPNEVFCPASPEGGNTRTCADCGACNGNPTGSTTRRNIAIVGHGSPAKLGLIRRASS